jgi:hypothetical protein
VERKGMDTGEKREERKSVKREMGERVTGEELQRGREREDAYLYLTE